MTEFHSKHIDEIVPMTENSWNHLSNYLNPKNIQRVTIWDSKPEFISGKRGIAGSLVLSEASSIDFKDKYFTI